MWKIRPSLNAFRILTTIGVKLFIPNNGDDEQNIAMNGNVRANFIENHGTVFLQWELASFVCNTIVAGAA